MGHTCPDCGEEFSTLSRVRMHDCPADVESFTVQVQARLITNESNAFKSLPQQGLNQDQPVFPDFDLAVEPGKSVPPEQVRTKAANSLDQIFREEHGLWDWAETVSKEQVREAPPRGQDVTEFRQVGSIEITEDGEITDTFVTLDELKSLITSN